MDVDQVLIEPLLTEKTNWQREHHKYAFHVDARANKLDVMRALQELYDVHPIDCNVSNVKGKPKRLRSRAGRTSSWKKAVVTLRSNESIPIFEGV